MPKSSTARMPDRGTGDDLTSGPVNRAGESHSTVSLCELGIGLAAPDVLLADEGQRILRILGFELARQAVAFENRELDEAWRVAIANMKNCLNIIVRPFGLAALKLGKERRIGFPRRTEDHRIAFQIGDIGAGAARHLAGLGRHDNLCAVAIGMGERHLDRIIDRHVLDLRTAVQN